MKMTAVPPSVTAGGPLLEAVALGPLRVVCIETSSKIARGAAAKIPLLPRQELGR